jgi:uncharacterized RDD family membrane protein YckC
VSIPASVSAPGFTRPAVAGYRYRASAALMDCLVLYTMIFVIGTSWLIIARIPAGPAVEAPPQVSALIYVVIGIYILATTALGRTLGMRAMGLRIVRSDNGAALDPIRVLSRSLVLLLVAGLLFWVHPALVVAYSLWMLFNTKRQMMHDQIVGTLVTRRAPSVVLAKTAPVAQPSLAKLDQPQARALLDDLDQVRRKARGDLHAASVPLFILGLLAIGGALADFSNSMMVSMLYWTFAGPVGLLLTAWRFHRLQRRHGVGTGASPLVPITILVTCAAVAYGLFLAGGVIAAIGFVALAITQRNRALATAAVIFGLVTGAQQYFGFISNSVYNRIPNASALTLLEHHGSAIVFAILGLLLLGVGVRALRQESTG